MSDFLSEVLDEIENGPDETRKTGTMSTYTEEFDRFANNEPINPDSEEESAEDKLKRMSQRDKSEPFHRGEEFKRVTQEAEENRRRSREKANEGGGQFRHHPDFAKYQRNPDRIIDE